MRASLRVGTTMRRAAVLAAMCAFLAATARQAAAGSCGDDIDGKRVACACGDVVVGDTVLWATDPVVTETCPDDGLTVMAPVGADSLTLNLGGQSIAGRGHGTGIRVSRGGRLGAVIVGGDADDTRGEIAHFATGIRANGRDVLREIRSIDIHHNTGDGLSIHASGVRLDDVRTERNGRDGLALGGHGNEIAGVVSSGNARDGLQVRGSAASIAAETKENGRDGAAIAGRGHHVDRLVTTGNARAGVKATGAGHDVAETKASGNDGGDLTGRPGAIR